MTLSLKIVWPKRHFCELKTGERFRVDDEGGGTEFIKSRFYENGEAMNVPVAVNLTTGVASRAEATQEVADVKTEVPVSSLFRDWLFIYGNGFYVVTGEDNNRTSVRNLFTGHVSTLDPRTLVYRIESITFGMAG